jgi:ADP-ribose pyrophosphatase
MMDSISWKLLERKTAYSSKFVTVYEDKVELPNGTIIDDYTVVEKPSIVMVVATDTANNLLVVREYKYGAGETLLALPAGHKKKDEQPLDAAKRELLEETGYGAGDFEDMGVIYDYPSKDIHKVFVIRAKNVEQVQGTQHEETENIRYELIDIPKLKAQITAHEWKASSALASITYSGILF